MSNKSIQPTKLSKEIDKLNIIEKYSEQVEERTNNFTDNQEGFNKDQGREGAKQRISFLKKMKIETPHVSGGAESLKFEELNGNIENFIGMAQVPIGLAGPLKVKGPQTNEDFFVPLATTEGALVASYNRGMKACFASGGVTSVCLIENMQRCPFFKFSDILEVGRFIKWVHQNMERFRSIVSESSRFAELIEIRSNIEGNSVILTFEFSTGDAAGQNMVTICTDKVCKYILENFSIKPVEWYIESNYAGDKKATALSFSSARGKKVTSEIILPEKVLGTVLKTSAQKMAKYWQAATLSVIQSGAIGAQGHVANGLTALFVACGQDVACIAESAVGLTRMEVVNDGDLYVSVTLPSLVVGTIGGGTGLSTQKECLEMLGCYGVGKVEKFAEIATALVLAGEVSIAAAMSVDHFTKAHENLGRKNG